MMTQMYSMNANNCTNTMSHAAGSAMGSFSEPAATTASMNIVLFLDAAILAASIIFILIGRILIGVTPS